MPSTAPIPAADRRADVQPEGAWRRLHRLASAPYRQAGRFAWHFARGKLGRDPVFRSLLERGDIPPQSRVLDIGCGQALLASLFASIDALSPADWPAPWGAPPRGCRYTGIELMPKDVERALASISSLPGPPQVLCADMCEATLPPSDVVVILDVLHYVDLAAQARVLRHVRDALARGAPQRQGPGRLLLRIGDQSSDRGFRTSQWVDRIVTLVRGHRVAPTFGRPLKEWVRLLQALGFQVQPVPMSRGTPFANVLLVAELTASA